jgi:hypothetical protein
VKGNSLNLEQKQKRFEGKNEYLKSIYANLCCPAFAFAIVDGINKASVVPVLDYIVRTIMNLYFNRITSIVDEEYDSPLPTSDHS